MKNTDLYNAAMSLVNAANFTKHVDKEYAQELLDKAQEYKDMISLDEHLEYEVNEFERKIKEGL